MPRFTFIERCESIMTCSTVADTLQEAMQRYVSGDLETDSDEPENTELESVEQDGEPLAIDLKVELVAAKQIVYGPVRPNDP